MPVAAPVVNERPLLLARYERHGCSRAAVEDAAHRVKEVADAYAFWYQMHLQ
jgi:hypothetical protein